MKIYMLIKNKDKTIDLQWVVKLGAEILAYFENYSDGQAFIDAKLTPNFNNPNNRQICENGLTLDK